MKCELVDGLWTLFYDGSKQLYNQKLTLELSNIHIPRSERSKAARQYNRQRKSWQQIIVVEGVTVIPEMTFYKCYNIKRVIFADTVIRIERYAFGWCEHLTSVTWSNNLEFIGWGAFEYCWLSSVFIPRKCKEIQWYAFQKNKKLTIFNVPQGTRIACPNVIFSTILFKKNPYSTYESQKFLHWIKNINSDEEATLHRICCSYELTVDDIVEKANLQETGLIAFKVENDIGITPSVYLKENPFIDITELDIIRCYVLKMMTVEVVKS